MLMLCTCIAYICHIEYRSVQKRQLVVDVRFLLPITDKLFNNPSKFIQYFSLTSVKHTSHTPLNLLNTI